MKDHRDTEGTENLEGDELTGAIIGAAIEVHRCLGPGLLESTYEACLAHELSERGFQIDRQLELPVLYKGLKIEAGYRIDLMVNGQVVLELKSVKNIEPIYEAQIITYLKLAEKRYGLLLNFNVPVLKNGIRRFLND